MHIFCKKCNFHFPPEGHIIFNTFNTMTSKCVKNVKRQSRQALQLALHWHVWWAAFSVPTQLNTKDSDDMLIIQYCPVFGVLYQKNQILILNQILLGLVLCWVIQIFTTKRYSF